MWITESLQIENNRRGYQLVCSDCEAYGLKKHGLTRSGVYMPQHISPKMTTALCGICAIEPIFLLSTLNEYLT